MTAFRLTRFQQRYRGASALTYGLLLGLVAVGTISSVETVGDSVTSLFGDVATDIAGGAPCAADSAGIDHPRLIHRQSTTVVTASDPSGSRPTGADSWQSQVVVSCADGTATAGPEQTVALTCGSGFQAQPVGGDCVGLVDLGAPAITAPPSASVTEGETTNVPFTIAWPDPPAAVDPVTVSLSPGTAISGGSISGNPSDGYSLMLTADGDIASVVTETATITATDTQGDVDIASVTITVTPAAVEIVAGAWADGSHARACRGYLEGSDNDAGSGDDPARRGVSAGAAANGIYTIDPDGAGGTRPPFGVYCDMATDGGGWTMFYETDETFSWWATYGFNAFNDMDDAAWEDLEDAAVEPIPQPGGANASFDPADKGITFTEVAGNWSFSPTGGTTPTCRADGFHKASATTLTGDKRLQNLSGANTYLWDDKSDTSQTEWCVENNNESDGIGVNSQWCVPYTNENANGTALYWPNPGDDLPNCNYHLQLLVR